MPFQAGQVIHVPAPSRSMLDAIAAGSAEIVRTDDTERAVAPQTEQPEPKPSRKGKRRDVVVH